MQIASELNSLNEINYKSKLKVFLLIILGFILFMYSFLEFYPIGDKIKAQIQAQLRGTGCNPDFDEIRMEWLMPKIIISNLIIPAQCLDRAGNPIKFNHVTLNYHLINFSPFGLPFRLDTEFSGQPLSAYYVLGINQQMIRMKDQKLSLNRLQDLIGDQFKLAGLVTLDLNLQMTKNVIKSLGLRAASKDFQIPSQNLQGFTVPNLKIGELFLEASSVDHPRLRLDKLIVGGADSPIRAKLEGVIDLQEENIEFSPMNLKGEIAFSESFKESLPLVEMMFQPFTQKDGFYQIRIGGTLGAPKPSAP